MFSISISRLFAAVAAAADGLWASDSVAAPATVDAGLVEIAPAAALTVFCTFVVAAAVIVADPAETPPAAGLCAVDSVAAAAGLPSSSCFRD